RFFTSWCTRTSSLSPPRSMVSSGSTRGSNAAHWREPVPAHDDLVVALQQWRNQARYKSPEDWLFASPARQGRWPYLAQQIMQRHILPVARKLGISKNIGWHTFRHTYSTLLRSTGAELKIMQELLRHSTIRVTLDTYTQAV